MEGGLPTMGGVFHNPTTYRNRIPERRVSDLRADDLLYTDDPEGDRQAGRAVSDQRPV
jgi:hypothetical protein